MSNINGSPKKKKGLTSTTDFPSKQKTIKKKKFNNLK